MHCNLQAINPGTSKNWGAASLWDFIEEMMNGMEVGVGFLRS